MGVLCLPISCQREPPLITVSGLTKRYGQRVAVDDVTFTIGKGEICGFLGPNGAGKTTTMRMITGYLSPSEGTINVFGHDVAEEPLEAKRRIGYLPESTPLYGDMRVGEYLAFVGRIKGYKGARLAAEVDRVMEATRIADRSRSLIKTLSKGYRQRVGIAQALVGDPDVLILDEPTIGLDPRQIGDVRGLIRELAGRHTIILSSHILPEVQAVCDTVLIMNRGKLIAADTPANLARRFAEGGEVTVTLAVDAETAAPIRTADGVADARLIGADDRSSVWGLTPTGDDFTPLRKGIVRLAAQRDWELIGLTHGSASLEEVYLSVITREESSS
ncbi:MAG: ABC transporter ATP-binding protein [Nitrospinae bacterium]|nr:ABC transporter ATP-binding protein [Nitrospinota bacterium]